ncbi:alpha-L-fucosidase [Flavihumibacter sp. UBA7668]|uniref:alpha-L-fucosidase n=1 Tax=Flavihumibacter sp. UBA7668 TaxID=1946542 RepID=UPI0025C3AB7E|nr:alpha-L-fucosidase [Flavihumibacter sp. UBA7668]
MYTNRFIFSIAIIIGLAACSGNTKLVEKIPEPAPYGVLPAERQLRWQELESYVLVHFTPTTFENKEWGYGDADPSSFNPSAFDASQIVQAAAAGGFKGLILVAKHHDGFALWPTKTTSYNISKSPWKNGGGDMVKEFETATRKMGLQFGVYCSPWDRNFPAYGSFEYVKAFREQLRELYSNYGQLFITWFDGANGGDGYYGGAREKRNIDRTTYYGWDTTWNMVRELQPGAVIFNDMGDVRWVGNEEGHAAETSWATFTPQPLDGKTVAAPGELKYWLSPEGTRNGEFWKPAECDVPLRPGWFYHPEQDHRVKTPAQLFDLYFKSVGRGAALDLGLSPDRRGLLHANDVESLSKFGALLKETFATNLASKAELKVSNIRGNAASKFGPKMLVDEDRYSYWATDDSVSKAEILLEWKEPVKFNIVRIRENIKLGQRIERIAIDVSENGNWKELATATSIGANRLVRLPFFVTAKQLRIRILQSPVCLAISDLAVFKEPDQLPGVSYEMKKAPDALDKSAWKLVSVSAESKLPAGAALHAFDNDPSTIWHTWNNEKEMMPPPQEIVIDMGGVQTIKAFTYLPRVGGSWGVVGQYEWQVSVDGKSWSTAATGEFSNIKANPIEQVVSLPAPIKCRYFRFIGKSSVEDNYISAAELGAL